MFGISAFAEAPFASLAGQTIIVALTGVQASGAVGTVTEDSSVALTGVEAAGAVGTVTVGERALALTGVEAIGAVGTVIGISSKVQI